MQSPPNGGLASEELVVNTKNFFLSFLPWVAFSVLATSHGAHGAVTACLVATGLSIWFAVKGSRASQSGRVKLIDATGIATFGAMTVIAALGNTAVQNHVIDFGRGGATFVLGAVMLGSVLFVPFTEQYARESVPQEYWHSPVFRSVNRRISTAWGVAVLLMASGHLLAGAIDPASAPKSGARPVDLLCNWVIPALLVLWAINYTKKVSADAGSATSATPAAPAQPASSNGNAR
jgi:hypothetical protein